MRSKQSILFVDDSPDVLAVIAESTAGMLWKAQLAQGASEAIELLKKHTFDVVVADLRMPKMDGIELLQYIGKHHPTTIRILLTGHNDNDSMQRAVSEAGVSRFLRKPWQQSVFTNMMEQALEDALLSSLDNMAQTKTRRKIAQRDFLNTLLKDQQAETAERMQGLQQRWDIVLNAISQPLLIIGDGYRIDGANQWAERWASQWHNHKSQNLIGQHCHQAMFGSETICEGCPIQSGSESGRLSHHTRGTQFVLDVKQCDLPGLGRSSLCIYHDITHEISLQSEIAHVDKMAAIGRLAGGVAHEINNPLQGIVSFSELAQKPGTTPEQLAHYHTIIQECAIRCRDIVSSLSNFSRKNDTSDRYSTDMNSLVALTVELLHNTSGRHIHFSEIQSDLPQCLMNKNQIQQVLVNLLQNALDATHEKKQEVEISVHYNKDTHHIVVRVDDGGDGVAPEQRKKIFDPFFTTKEEGKGTGLGLSISHTIIEKHGGSLKVIDSPLGGVRFEVSLPAIASQ